MAENLNSDLNYLVTTVLGNDPISGFVKEPIGDTEKKIIELNYLLIHGIKTMVMKSFQFDMVESIQINLHLFKPLQYRFTY